MVQLSEDNDVDTKELNFINISVRCFGCKKHLLDFEDLMSSADGWFPLIIAIAAKITISNQVMFCLCGAKLGNKEFEELISFNRSTGSVVRSTKEGDRG